MTAPVVAFDAMGSDLGPGAMVAGAVQAAQDGVSVLLVGDEAVLGPLLPPRVDLPILHAPQVVEMGEAPVVAVRSKRDSSLVRAVQAVRDGRAAAVVSCGSTGAAMAAALFELGRLGGVDRPALTTVAPRADGGRLVLLDLGANADCQPRHLAQFAVMGDTFARVALGLDHPRVGLLANGEEEGKGNDLVRRAAPLIAALPLDYAGLVEPTGAFRGACDVLVTDGFTGNVMLKTVEATADVVAQLLRAEVSASLRGRVSGRLLAPLLRDFRARTDARAVGGALLLGVQGVVVVGHGRSDATAARSALGHAAAFAGSGLVARTGAAIEAALPAPLAPRGGSR